MNIQSQRLCTLYTTAWHAGADITDYFNYGFTEETWRKYAEKQRMLRGDSAKVWMGQGRGESCGASWIAFSVLGAKVPDATNRDIFNRYSVYVWASIL
jgi:hypothetical protein